MSFRIEIGEIKEITFTKDTTIKCENYLAQVMYATASTEEVYQSMSSDEKITFPKGVTVFFKTINHKAIISEFGV